MIPLGAFTNGVILGIFVCLELVVTVSLLVFHFP